MMSWWTRSIWGVDCLKPHFKPGKETLMEGWIKARDESYSANKPDNKHSMSVL